MSFDNYISIAIVAFIVYRIFKAINKKPSDKSTPADAADKVFGKRSADIEIYTPKKDEDDAS